MRETKALFFYASLQKSNPRLILLQNYIEDGYKFDCVLRTFASKRIYQFFGGVDAIRIFPCVRIRDFIVNCAACSVQDTGNSGTSIPLRHKSGFWIQRIQYLLASKIQEDNRTRDI